MKGLGDDGASFVYRAEVGRVNNPPQEAMCKRGPSGQAPHSRS